MMAPFIMTVLLIIFTLGCSAIVFSQVNILWRSYCVKKKLLAEQRLAQPIALKVVARNDMSARHFSVRLQAINNDALTNFLPGQYLTLISKDLSRRCYSLAAWDKEANCYELGIQREVEGKVSSWLYEHLQVGTVINALPPKGNFVFNAKEAQHTVLIAGGIGITPLRAMLHQFIEHQYIEQQTKSMSLFYSAKSAEEMCYVDEFIQLTDDHPNFKFYPYLSKSNMGRLSVERIIQQLELDPKEFEFYICGPNSMMDELKTGLVEQGIASDNIHFERFGIEASLSSGKDFLVELGNNKSFVFNKQRTLLDAMEEQGIEIESECRSGECGQCKVSLLAGNIKPLIDMECDLNAGQILPCCSVPESDLVIEL